MNTILPAVGMLLAAFLAGFALRSALSHARRRRSRPYREFGRSGSDMGAVMRAQRDSLARESDRLADQVEKLLALMAEEQALRRQLQEELARAHARPFDLAESARSENEDLKLRLEATERRYRELKAAIWPLLRRLQSRRVSAAA